MGLPMRPQTTQGNYFRDRGSDAGLCGDDLGLGNLDGDEDLAMTPQRPSSSQDTRIGRTGSLNSKRPTRLRSFKQMTAVVSKLATPKSGRAREKAARRETFLALKLKSTSPDKMEQIKQKMAESHLEKALQKARPDLHSPKKHATRDKFAMWDKFVPLNYVKHDDHARKRSKFFGFLGHRLKNMKNRNEASCATKIQTACRRKLARRKVLRIKFEIARKEMAKHEEKERRRQVHIRACAVVDGVIAVLGGKRDHARAAAIQQARKEQMRRARRRGWDKIEQAERQLLAIIQIQCAFRVSLARNRFAHEQTKARVRHTQSGALRVRQRRRSRRRFSIGVRSSGLSRQAQLKVRMLAQLGKERKARNKSAARELAGQAAEGAVDVFEPSGSEEGCDSSSDDDTHAAPVAGTNRLGVHGATPEHIMDEVLRQEREGATVWYTRPAARAKAKAQAKMMAAVRMRVQLSHHFDYQHVEQASRRRKSHM